jgi:hypothetical protein
MSGAVLRAALPARVGIDALRRKADPACIHCPNGGGGAGFAPGGCRPSARAHPAGPAHRQLPGDGDGRPLGLALPSHPGRRWGR